MTGVGDRDETIALSALIDRLAAGQERRNEDFARALAARLHEAGPRLSLPAIEALGITDVVVTFSMDRAMRLVVTGWLPDGAGDVTVRFEEARFPDVAVLLHAAAREAAYTFCTLDFSVRGRPCVLFAAAAGWPAGTELTARALATVGGRQQVRVVTPAGQASVPPQALRWSDR